MKHKVNDYAKALVEALLNKGANNKKITKNFVLLLHQNQDFKKASQILEKAEAMLLKKTGGRKVVLETARPVDAKSLLKDFIKKEDVVQTAINPSLVAGVKIAVNGNKQLDFSLRKKLENIF